MVLSEMTVTKKDKIHTVRDCCVRANKDKSFSANRPEPHLKKGYSFIALAVVSALSVTIRRPFLMRTEKKQLHDYRVRPGESQV